MKGLQNSAIGDFTRGGQTVLMFVRMIWEVLQQFARYLIVIYLLTTAGLFWATTEPYDRYIAGQYVRVEVATDVLGNGTKVTTLRDPAGHEVKVRFADIAAAPFMWDTCLALLHRWLHCMLMSVSFATALLSLSIFAVWRFGRAQRHEQLLRGSPLAEATEVTRLLQESALASDLTVAGVPLVKGSEVQHILLTGSPGTGKTTTLYELFKSIRERGDRVICYSPSGDFISAFYRQDKDILLNPFDRRCPRWDPWKECLRDYHFDMLAGAMIPTGKAADPMWEKAARVVVSNLLQRMGEFPDRSIRLFLRALSEIDFPTLSKFLDGMPAVALTSPTAEKTAQGIRITATASAQALRYLPEDGPSFNLREWVLSEANDQWVFLNATASQRDAARPLLSAWLEIFTNSILSLPEDRQRRIWLIVDELPSLHRLPSLPAFLAESRKFGGCGVIAFQQISQLREIYDREGADSLTGLCATWVCLRQNDPPTAEWTSKSFGEAEILEQSEGLSYGSHEMRDGVSLQQNRKMRSIVLPSEISNLDDLEGYVRLRGKLQDRPLPIAHFRMKRESIPVAAAAFQEIKRAPVLLRHGQELERLLTQSTGSMVEKKALDTADKPTAADAPPTAPTNTPSGLDASASVTPAPRDPVVVPASTPPIACASYTDVPIGVGDAAGVQ